MQIFRQPAAEITSIRIQPVEGAVKVTFTWSDLKTTSNLATSVNAAKRMIAMINCADLPCEVR